EHKVLTFNSLPVCTSGHCRNRIPTRYISLEYVPPYRLRIRRYVWVRVFGHCLPLDCRPPLGLKKYLPHGEKRTYGSNPLRPPMQALCNVSCGCSFISHDSADHGMRRDQDEQFAKPNSICSSARRQPVDNEFWDDQRGD